MAIRDNPSGGDTGIDDDPDPFSDDLVDCQQRKDAILDLKDQLKSLDPKGAQYAELYRRYAQLLKALVTKLTATMEKSTRCSMTQARRRR